jgi:hypothetical protein
VPAWALGETRRLRFVLILNFRIDVVRRLVIIIIIVVVVIVAVGIDAIRVVDARKKVIEFGFERDRHKLSCGDSRD